MPLKMNHCSLLPAGPGLKLAPTLDLDSLVVLCVQEGRKGTLLPTLAAIIHFI